MHQPRRAIAALLAALAVTVFATPSRAAAHPFGDPQTVAISLDATRPDTVHIRWKAGGLDDLTLLGVSLGLLPRDRVMLDGAVFYQASDATAIGPSPRFAEYLLRQISVAGDGETCAGTVRPPTDLAKSGVTLDFDCPAAIGTATVVVRTLTDLNSAYQTLATGPNGERAVYAAGKDTHDWVLGSASAHDTRRSAAAQIGLVVGGSLLVVVLLFLLVRRKQRTKRVAR
ncbi:hypothetical protein AB0H43_14310 [Hamadaea sp. NPDC050747]|uniref:hypothetical protein n=1 Tax=Hamadaea sp. NPDC050747 TaxID=3155789 RepID=UPI0033E7F4A6